MRSVLLICNKEELEKINYQLEYMGKPYIADNGMFPRYFTVKEERFVEIIQQEDLLKDKNVIAVIPA